MVSEEELQMVAFNMSIQHIQHISNYLYKADLHYSTGNYIICLQMLEVAMRNITQSLTETEYENLLNLLKEAIDCYWKEKPKEDPEDIDVNNKSLLKSKVDKFKKNLLKYLDKYGYLIRKVEDIKKMF